MAVLILECVKVTLENLADTAVPARADVFSIFSGDNVPTYAVSSTAGLPAFGADVSATTTSAPEPTTLLLVGTALIGAALLRRKRK